MSSRVFLFSRRSRLILAAAALAMATAVWAPMPAAAQDSANLLRKIERLQKELNDLQRYVYKGGTPPAGSSAAPASGAVGTDVAARMQLQITQLQDQLRSMNGRVEEVQHRIRVLEQRLDRMAEDLELRLQRIEDAVAAGGGVPPAAAGTPPEDAGQGEAAGARESSGAGAAAVELPADTTPREQYDYAFDLLKQRDYPAAAAALESFLEKNPDDPLAGNALYWLGETHYVRKQYKDAARLFLDGYKKYPTGSKAPDNLLKLGMSLSAMGEGGSACKTLDKLISTFPKAPSRIIKAAKSEQKKLDCK